MSNNYNEQVEGLDIIGLKQKMAEFRREDIGSVLSYAKPDQYSLNVCAANKSSASYAKWEQIYAGHLEKIKNRRLEDLEIHKKELISKQPLLKNVDGRLEVATVSEAEEMKYGLAPVGKVYTKRRLSM